MAQTRTSNVPGATASDARVRAGLARLLADETRATMCLALLDGRAWTAGELARAAGVAPSTATVHLGLLVDGGLLAEERQGRHRYLRLSGPGAAGLVEDLAGRAGAGTLTSGSLRAVSASRALARARTCYDHLAGRLGVALLDALCRKGLVDRQVGLSLTEPGMEWLTDLGIEVPTVQRTRRPVVRECLDWTERRHHLAGTVGAALCDHMLEQRWIERTSRPREIRVTERGADELRQRLGLDLTS
ncbi:MAG TPA: helix-turn-helix transcriptional regulator [Actinomycetales bacterium]|nr:helix-turn-helix transcriptional regulator [Actinomycetales bacterium]